MGCPKMQVRIRLTLQCWDTTQGVGIPLPLSSLALEMMQALKVDGKAGDDYRGLVPCYEKLAGLTVESPNSAGK